MVTNNFTAHLTQLNDFVLAWQQWPFAVTLSQQADIWRMAHHHRYKWNQSVHVDECLIDLAG